MALALSLAGLLLLLGGLATVVACLFPGYRARHPGRVGWAAVAAVLGFLTLVAAGQLMKQVEETHRAQPSGPIAISEQPPSGSAAVTTPPGNSPIERRPWIVIPLAFLLALFMITAMLEWSAAFLVRRPSRGTVPVEPDELKDRLLALNRSDVQYRLVPGKQCDLELEWDVVDTSWHNLFSKIKLNTVYRTRMLFVPARHEVRWCEWLRSSGSFIGFRGWRPVFDFSWSLQVGYIDVVWKGRAYGVQAGFPPRVERVYDFSLNTVQVKRDISGVVMGSGWTFRPVIFWFQAGRSRLSALLDSYSPTPFPSWPETRVWLLVAAGSYVLFLGYLLWAIGGFTARDFWTRQNTAVVAAISAVWWGMWGLLTWLLVCLAKPKRKHA